MDPRFGMVEKALMITFLAVVFAVSALLLAARLGG